MRRLLLLLCLIASALLLGTGHAYAWWNNDWTLRLKITADAGPNGAAITEPIGRTQILVRLFAGNFDFSNTKEDGSDLRFIGGDDKTPLHYHIERFNQKDQIGLVWVDFPDLAPGSATPIYLYWGNAKAADGSDARGTFDPDQLLVYHFTEENGLPKDTTGFASNALTAGTRDEAGIIGFGLRFDREKPLVRIAKSASLAIPEGQALTVSLWLQPDPGVKTAVLFSDRDGTNALTIGLDGGAPYALVEGPNGSHRVAAKLTLGGGWQHLAFVATDKLTLLVDGKPAGEAAGRMPAINGQPTLGGAEVAGSPRYVGLIDEFRIAKVARPLGALQVAIASEGPDGKLLSLDQPEQSSAGAPNYFLIIINSVTVDAWVVIFLLGIMAGLSWTVIYTKIVYLNRVTKANKVFHSEYRRLVTESNGDHMAALTTVSELETRGIRASPLYRLAKIGVREMQERVNSGRLQAGGMLSPQSLAAIRAPMETGLVHEQHRAGNMMVMLTIAISGGPFLGLLGTVVGVMITFAAIAAAGDVNVNAIAPGIASALLATVAGLFVAIPAMFGYNFLLIRIKDVGAVTNAFVEETITRMGEARATARPAPVLPPPPVSRESAPAARIAPRPRPAAPLFPGVSATPAAPAASAAPPPAAKPPVRPPVRPAPPQPATTPSGQK